MGHSPPTIDVDLQSMLFLGRASVLSEAVRTLAASTYRQAVHECRRNQHEDAGQA